MDQKILKQLLEEVREIKRTMVTKDEAKNFLTKQDAKNFLTKQDAKNFVTKNYLDNALENFVTKDYLDNALEKLREEIASDTGDIIQEFSVSVDDTKASKEDIHDLDKRITNIERKLTA